MSSFRRRLMMSVKEQKEYTELKCLRSTGTQYIDTEFKPNSNTRIIVRAKPKSLSTAFFFGTRQTVYKNTFCAVLESATKTLSYFRLDYYTNTSANRLKEVTEITYEIHCFEIDKGKLYLDNVKYMNPQEATEFQCDYNLVLFGINTSNTITKSNNISIYDCKIYDNDVLIRDMIPVLDKNSVACMYDKVNKKYYYNKGTGEFLYEEKSLFNTENLQIGYAISANGVISTNSNFNCTEFIKVNQSKYILSQILGKISNWNLRIHAYDENKNWIKQIFLQSIPTEKILDVNFKIDDKAIKYIRISIANENFTDYSLITLKEVK